MMVWSARAQRSIGCEARVYILGGICHRDWTPEWGLKFRPCLSPLSSRSACAPLVKTDTFRGKMTRRQTPDINDERGAVMSDIFVSYARPDEPQAKHVADALRKRG